MSLLSASCKAAPPGMAEATVLAAERCRLGVVAWLEGGAPLGMVLVARFEGGAPLEMVMAARFWIINYVRPWLDGVTCRS